MFLLKLLLFPVFTLTMTVKQCHLVAIQVSSRVNVYYISNATTDLTLTLYLQQIHITHNTNVILQISTTDHHSVFKGLEGNNGSLMNADVEANRQFILYASHTFAAVREVRREQSDCWS